MTGSAIIRHTYKVSKVLKQYTIHELIQTTVLSQTEKPTPPILTNLIRIEQFRFCSNGSGFDLYLRLRNTNNWAKCEKVTGLFKTNQSCLFYGDHRNKGRNLLVFHFIENDILIIDYYLGYCPYTKGGEITPQLNEILSKYN